MKLNPAAASAAILVTELLVFFTVTAFMTFLISHASSVEPAAGDAPPPAFPVIAYDGDRGRPADKSYFVVTWSEWERAVAKRPRATLLLPEPAGSVKIGDAGQATFTATDAPDSRQAVELKWQFGNTEQHVRYLAAARSIEPRYYREVGTRTFLMGALAGFGIGLLVGRAMRRRYLPRTRLAPPPAP